MTPLLPIGLHDSIGTEAYWLNRLKQTCLQCMYGFGYDLVEPTPLEQEDKTQPATGESRFRVHDPSTDAPLGMRPVSHREIPDMLARSIPRPAAKKVCR